MNRCFPLKKLENYFLCKKQETFMKRKKVWVIFFLLMEKKKFAKEDMQCKKKNCGTRAHL